MRSPVILYQTNRIKEMRNCQQEAVNAPETRKWELSPLRKIPDNYEKIVIAMECDLPQYQNGFKIAGAVDFLLDE